ncbi:MAG: class I SAM-dependent methyltransferase [Candidatus Lokiarchaeota archaeon]|nr:class I SAM-dependent methyltransferase [Candidatus Lokiarchaeota archaeon]
MTGVISNKIQKTKDQNDLDIVENIVFPIFLKRTEQDIHYWKEIRLLMMKALKEAHVNSVRRKVFWTYVNRKITKGIKKGKRLSQIEAEIRTFLKRHMDEEKDRTKNTLERGKRSFEKVKDYVVGEKVLDLGAGDGLLALEIKERLGKEVFLVDVVDYNYTDLPLLLYNQGDKIPLEDQEVDTTIIFVVLHHANNPLDLLKEAARVTKKRLVILEGYIEDEDIRITNCFMDWFYNRIIRGADINIPLNFLKLKEWEKELNNYGFNVIETKYIGIDEPIVPEYHVFIIAERKQ